MRSLTNLSVITDAYIKDKHVYDDAIANATTPEEYQSAVDAKIALNKSAHRKMT